MLVPLGWLLHALVFHDVVAVLDPVLFADRVPHVLDGYSEPSLLPSQSVLVSATVGNRVTLW